MKSFRIQIPGKSINELNIRLAQTRWPKSLPNAEWKKGVPSDYLQSLTKYWQEEFDWKKQEDQLNRYPQFITEIDGQPIHFMHIKSPLKNARPLMLVHGWPGSFADFIEMIEPLTNPSDKKHPFDLVIPSIPGFGFSVPVKSEGWNMFRIGAAFAELMTQLGYEKYAIHGSDVGAGVVAFSSMVAPQRLIGTHITTDFVSVAAMGMFPTDTSYLSADEKLLLNKMIEFKKTGTAYLDLQSTRPQTLGYLLNDSPVGQLAWIVEKYKEWIHPSKLSPEDALGKDAILRNVSLYWFNEAGAASAEMIYENMTLAKSFGEQKNDEGSQSKWTAPKVPSAIAAFGVKREESLLKKMASFAGEPNQWSFYEEGCHFPAMEVPLTLAEDLRKFFGRLAVK